MRLFCADRFCDACFPPPCSNLLSHTGASASTALRCQLQLANGSTPESFMHSAPLGCEFGPGGSRGRHATLQRLAGRCVGSSRSGAHCTGSLCACTGIALHHLAVRGRIVLVSMGRALHHLFPTYRHVVMIGDSTVRYQFRALVYSLHYGHTTSKGAVMHTAGVLFLSAPCSALARRLA